MSSSISDDCKWRRNGGEKGRESMPKKKKGYVEIVSVVDRSGSMSPLTTDVIGGFNQFLKDQQEFDGDANMTLAMFNHEYEVILDGVPIQDVKPLTTKTYKAGGMTALIDAVGRTIDAVLMRTDKAKTKPDKIIVGIITDGLENSSTEYTTPQLKKMIETLEAGNWEFHYMGADPEGFADAMSWGIQSINMTAWDHTSVGTQAVYASYSNTVASSRGETTDEVVGSGTRTGDPN